MLFFGLNKTLWGEKKKSILPPLLGLEVVPRLAWRSLVCHTPCEFRLSKSYRDDGGHITKSAILCNHHRSGNLGKQSSINPS